LQELIDSSEFYEFNKGYVRVHLTLDHLGNQYMVLDNFFRHRPNISILEELTYNFVQRKIQDFLIPIGKRRILYALHGDKESYMRFNILWENDEIDLAVINRSLKWLNPPAAMLTQDKFVCQDYISLYSHFRV